MRADTRTVSIEAPAHHVVTFLEDPTNLPRWAVGFAKTVRQTASGWIVHTIHTATCRAGHVFYRPGETGEAMFLLVWSCPDPVIDCTVDLLSGTSIAT